MMLKGWTLMNNPIYLFCMKINRTNRQFIFEFDEKQSPIKIFQYLLLEFSKIRKNYRFQIDWFNFVHKKIEVLKTSDVSNF